MMKRTHTPTLVLTLALALLLACCSCTRHAPEPVTESAPEPSGPYLDGSAFSQTGGRFTYDDGSTVATLTGVDVSSHQSDIDWQAVAADGIGFAFLRVGWRGSTEGGLYPDERFASNLQGAHDAGIGCGAYFYSQATSEEEAEEEAAFVLGLLGEAQLEYPVAFDYEVVPSTRIANVDAQTVSQVGSAFCAAIRAGGREPMLYGNTFDLARIDSALLEEYAIWCAEYDDGPSYERRFDVWQYTNQGTVAGIGRLCDLNLYVGNVR